jgi:hypothetical protein
VWTVVRQEAIMATKKKRAVKKRKTAKKPATLKVQNLAAATAASVRAVLGRGLPGRPGILAGIWIDKAAIAKLELSPKAVAAAITKQASLNSGIKLKPGLIAGDGGVLVGYVQPEILSR